MSYFSKFPQLIYDIKGNGNLSLFLATMTVPQFEAFVADKYTSPDGIHHYTITQTSGDTTKTINIGSDNTGHSATAASVTNRQYELDLQTEYSKIRLIHKDYINQFITEFEDLTSEGTTT